MLFLFACCLIIEDRFCSLQYIMTMVSWPPTPLWYSLHSHLPKSTLYLSLNEYTHACNNDSSDNNKISIIIVSKIIRIGQRNKQKKNCQRIAQETHRCKDTYVQANINATKSQNRKLLHIGKGHIRIKELLPRMMRQRISKNVI